MSQGLFGMRTGPFDLLEGLVKGIGKFLLILVVVAIVLGIMYWVDSSSNQDLMNSSVNFVTQDELLTIDMHDGRHIRAWCYRIEDHNEKGQIEIIYDKKRGTE